MMNNISTMSLIRRLDKPFPSDLKQKQKEKTNFMAFDNEKTMIEYFI
jgi:hypothetical protein